MSVVYLRRYATSTEIYSLFQILFSIAPCFLVSRGLLRYTERLLRFINIDDMETLAIFTAVLGFPFFLVGYLKRISFRETKTKVEIEEV